MILKILLFSFYQAFGCSCAPQDIKKEFERSDYVMIATVTEKTARDFDPYDDLNRITDYEITLNIKRSYKGDLRKKPHVMTASDDARCGFNLKLGETYLFWMDKPHPDSPVSVPIVHICSRTKHISQAKDDIKWLDRKSSQDLVSSVLFN
jgi:hypothetical protein